MADPYRHIAVDDDQGVLILTILEQKVNEYELAEAMGKELVQAATNGASKKVVVDMGNVQYMSSVGYMPFLTLHRKVKDAGAQLVLCNLSDVITDIFTTTRLLINPSSQTSLFLYAPSRSDAVAMLLK